jgi:hypothetical protein
MKGPQAAAPSSPALTRRLHMFEKPGKFSDMRTHLSTGRPSHNVAPPDRGGIGVHAERCVVRL